MGLISRTCALDGSEAGVVPEERVERGLLVGRRAAAGRARLPASGEMRTACDAHAPSLRSAARGQRARAELPSASTAPSAHASESAGHVPSLQPSSSTVRAAAHREAPRVAEPASALASRWAGRTVGRERRGRGIDGFGERWGAAARAGRFISSRGGAVRPGSWRVICAPRGD